MAGYQMELDLKIMPVGAALQQAKITSGLTYEQIAGRTGWNLSVVKKIFGEHQDRLPDIQEVATICTAIGNTFLLEWLAAQVEDIPGAAGGNVAMQFCRLSDGFAKLARTTAEALGDGSLDAGEANSMLRHARNVREDADQIMAIVAPIAGQIFSAGKWQPVAVMCGQCAPETRQKS